MTISNSIYDYQDEDHISLKAEVERLRYDLEQAQVNSQGKTTVLANIAHELRTPLNTIIGFSQILARQTTLSGEQQEYLNLILKSGEHLLDLIEDVLNITNIESGDVQLKTSEFNFHVLIESIRAIYQMEANEKGLGFDVEISETIPRFIIADRNKIHQILSNFLSNALKFTHKGMIQLSINVKENIDTPDNNIINLAVSDTGMGIKPEELHKVFTPYQQTSSGLLSNKGSGLGLAITKKFVELMDGTISVQSQWQEGTIFSCDLQVIPAGKTQETGNRVSESENNNELETQEHYVIHPVLRIDELSPELQERLKQAATGYSLEQIRHVVAAFPNDVIHLKQFILEKADEFDFAAILDLYSDIC